MGNKDSREMAIYFVGREQETRQILKALNRRYNVILMGKYGIGRTSLTRHVAEIGRNRWNFISLDFSQTPAKVCDHLANSLLPKNNGKAMGYRHNRFQIANLDFDGQRQPVLVLDDIGKLTPQKVELIRYLAMLAPIDQRPLKIEGRSVPHPAQVGNDAQARRQNSGAG